MNKYTIYCTPEQTKKALELGAPIINYPIQMAPYGVPKYERQLPSGKWIAYMVPTAEQMISWLEEQEEISDLHIFKPAIHWTFELYASNGDGKNNQPLFNTRKEATFAAIDAALEYLTSKKTKQ